MMLTPEYLTLPDRRLAYQRFRGQKSDLSIIFLGGYASDMTGTKASFLAEKCLKSDVSLLRFDYQGHGQSGGAFKDGTIGSWFEDTVLAMEHLTEGHQIVIGSSMGGWLGLKLAMKKPERIKAFIGIAAAPDFTEDLMWLRFSPDQRKRLEREGFLYDETAPEGEQAPITMRLIEEARDHLLLRSIIPVACPVRLLQGLSDLEVPWQHTIRILENVRHEDVRATLIKDGDHRLSRPEDLDLLWRTVEEFI